MCGPGSCAQIHTDADSTQESAVLLLRVSRVMTIFPLISQLPGNRQFSVTTMSMNRVQKHMDACGLQNFMDKHADK